jgi:transmembrane sensor
MNTPDGFYTDDALDEQAASWLCEQAEGFSPGRAQAFAEWRGRNSRHADAVARVERTMAILAELPAVRAPLEARWGRAGEKAPRGGRLVRFFMPVSLAGLAAASFVGAVAWWGGAHRTRTSEHYEANAGAQRRVALRDGSTVDLNTGSEMRVQITGRERRVALGAGEAHFQVMPDAARPFVVTAGGVSVRAVGTAFSVRLADDAVDVLVVEGRVEVTRQSPQWQDAPERPVLGAGERARVSRANPAIVPKIEKVDAASLRTMLAWQEALTSFADVPLRELVFQFNRRNETQLVLEDPELGERRVGGMIALDQVEGFVRLLEHDGDVVAERQGSGKIVLRRAR